VQVALCRSQDGAIACGATTCRTYADVNALASLAALAVLTTLTALAAVTTLAAFAGSILLGIY
jgi:hypothetical protein